MVKPKKSLGQNFLKSNLIINTIVKTSDLKISDLVLEIGPGKGALTEKLLQKVSKVVAVEKDGELVEFLKEKFKKEIDNEKLVLVREDVLDFSLGKLGKYKLVANIPYYITGAILKKFLSSKNQPKSITLLIQKEVADRIVASDGKESIFSISTKIYGKPYFIKKVSKKAFSPVPKIDSAVLLIKNISKKHFATNKEEGLFFKILKLGFSHKRKLLLNNLSLDYDRSLLENVFRKLKLNLKIRAENLSAKDWLNLARKLKT